MASSANIFTQSSVYSIIFFKQENIFSCQLIIPVDTQAAELDTHRWRRSVPTALIRFIFKRWNFLKYLLEVHESSHTWRTHTHTHTRMWTHRADWQPVAPQSEVSQRTSWLSAVTHAEVIDKPLTCETNCTSESETETMPEKNVLTHTKAQSYSNNSDRIWGVALKRLHTTQLILISLKTYL